MYQTVWGLGLRAQGQNKVHTPRPCISNSSAATPATARCWFCICICAPAPAPGSSPLPAACGSADPSKRCRPPQQTTSLQADGSERPRAAPPRTLAPPVHTVCDCIESTRGTSATFSMRGAIPSAHTASSCDTKIWTRHDRDRPGTRTLKRIGFSDSESFVFQLTRKNRCDGVAAVNNAQRRNMRTR